MELIKITNLTKTYPKMQEPVLRNVDLDITKGEILGLVGESGCGKSTLAKCILRLIKVEKGSVFYKDKDLLKISSKEIRNYRKNLQKTFGRRSQ